MIQRLNPWQRLWGMFAIVFFVTTLALIATLWPKHDAAVVADLRAPECREWREAADPGSANFYPEAGEPCRAMRLFRYKHHFTLHSEADYESYLLQTGLRKTLSALGIWAGVSAFVYVLGMYTRKMVGALPGRRKRGPG